MEKNNIIKIVVIGLIIIGAIVYYFVNNNSYDEILVNEAIENIANDLPKQNTEKKENIKVYIAGEVANPGVIEIEEGSRIDDAIKLVGGLTEKADLSNVNLAYELSDGEKVVIPNIDDDSNVSNEENQNGKVNINKADLSELTQIPGVGESTAKKIIEYREKNGKFTNIEDIKNVSGIGDSKYENIKDYISTK